MSNSRSGTFVVGVLVGSAVGTVTGLMLAPRPGRETRHLLKKSAEALPELAEDLSASLQLQADRFSESALKRWDDTLERLREAVTAGAEAAQAQRQLLQQSLNDPTQPPKR
ncbi:YtxH domain-containing protein [Synechococcales cyanobacterium C]|uniref:YtxH domain-containing protein n=1 Tax=Petrachloros mirabilis ULC683 TaxID=2781853 RepID=A0A8K2A260_9CYAN|nr:YtxH domain-containing protein [Petrachloros mirabilis]NCJ08177.1 YtxH domain-containing protein [Petrachloros mirabilis ULC683]